MDDDCMKGSSYFVVLKRLIRFSLKIIVECEGLT